MDKLNIGQTQHRINSTSDKLNIKRKKHYGFVQLAAGKKRTHLLTNLTHKIGLVGYKTMVTHNLTTISYVAQTTTNHAILMNEFNKNIRK